MPPADTPHDDPAGQAALVRLDRALETILEDPEYAKLRPGPWWALERRGQSTGAGWKRAFLERVPGAGAVHWGHWFLVVTTNKSVLSLIGSTDVDRESSSLVEIPVPDLDPSGTARLLVREIEGNGRLVTLARRSVLVALGRVHDSGDSEMPKVP